MLDDPIVKAFEWNTLERWRGDDQERKVCMAMADQYICNISLAEILDPSFKVVEGRHNGVSNGRYCGKSPDRATRVPYKTVILLLQHRWSR